MQASAEDVNALCVAAHEASVHAPSDRRRYWMMLRDAAGVLYMNMRHPAPGPRRRAAREMRLAATLCLAAYRRAAPPTAQETTARALLLGHVYDGTGTARI